MATIRETRNEPVEEGLLYNLRQFSWGFWIKIVLAGAAAVFIAFLFGSYVAGPGRISAQDGYVPEALSQLKAASISIANPDGTVATLPVRLVETVAARNAGLGGVGPRALDNTFLLYTYSQERTLSTRVPQEGIRTPLELAVINGSGEVTSIHKLVPATTTFAAPGPHQWLLMTKDGVLEHFGITVGSQLDTTRIKPF